MIDPSLAPFHATTLEDDGFWSASSFAPAAAGWTVRFLAIGESDATGDDVLYWTIPVAGWLTGSAEGEATEVVPAWVEQGQTHLEHPYACPHRENTCYWLVGPGQQGPAPTDIRREGGKIRDRLARVEARRNGVAS